MPLTPQFSDSPWSGNWTEIIDVRSPAEFAIDHIPGAINLPVLTNEQRAQVGTLYRQESPFAARKLGAALVAANIARHLEQHFIHQPKTYQPLIYCWRGGQRSGSLALVLGQIGWRVTLLTGGYKTYRRQVQTQLDQLAQQLEYRVICGMTGTGKTQLLHWLETQVWAGQKVQTLDLEALANHRGSLLGQPSALEVGIELATSQPSQKMFESRLLLALKALQPAQPVWIEAESNKIGQLYLPKSLWAKLGHSPCLEIQRPMAARVEMLLAEYQHFVANPACLKQTLGPLKARYGQATLNQWFSRIDAQAWPDFVAQLLATHYDPAYQRSINQHFQPARLTLQLPEVSAAGWAEVVPQLQAFGQES